MNNLRYTIFFLLLSIMAVFEVSYGQLGYSSRKYLINTYVPENQIRQIEKDNNGFYWIITMAGRLIRWNGNNGFKVINPPMSDSGRQTSFGAFRSDHKGRLYTKEFTTNRYYWVDEKSNVRLVDTINDEIALLSHAGNFSAPEESWSATIKNNDSSLVTDFRKQINNTGGDNYFVQYYLDVNTFYLVRKEYLLYYEKGKITKIRLLHPIDNNAMMVGKYLLYKSGSLYYLYDKTMMIWSGVLPGLNDNKKDGTLAYQNCHKPEATFTFFGNTIYKITVKNNRPEVVPYFSLAPDQPPLSCIYIDEVHQRVLAADISGGFVLYSRNFYYYQGDPVPGSPLNTVYAVLPVKEKVYISYDIYKLRIPGNRATIEWHASPIQLRSGDIFYPSSAEILLCDKDLRLKKYWPGPNRGIRQSAIDVYGRIFYAGKELYEYLPDKMEIDTIHLRMSPEPNSSDLVMILAKGPPGILYASIGNDIYEIKISDYTARGILKRPAESTFGAVKDMRYDAEYGVLFLTIRGRLCYIDTREGRIRNFPLNGNKDLLSCHYLLRDNDGDCWLPTNSGLFFLSKENLRAFMRDGSRQLAYVPANIGQKGQKEEFNSGFSTSGVCVGDSIYLSSMHGVVIFSAREAKRFLKAGNTSRILIDKLTVDDQPVENSNDHIIFPAGFKRSEITVDFAFNSIFGASLEYQLLGLRDTSIQLMYENNKIVLQSLYPGKYTLRVQVTNHPEVPPLVLHIEVAQYWYKTKKAIALWFLLAGLLLWLILSWRLHHARNMALEEVDKNRKELFTIISHDLRSPLKAYQGLAEVISHLLRKGDYERVNKLALQIDSTGAKLDLLMDNLLNWNILQQEKLIIQKESVDVAQLMQEHVPIYQEFAAQKKITIAFDYNTGCTVNTDKTMVALMVRNLLDNAIKNSPPGEKITAAVYRNEQDEVRLVISNTCQEKDREKLQTVRNLIRKKEKWDAGSKGMGFGLRMVYLAAIKTDAELSLDIYEKSVRFSVLFRKQV